MTLGWLSFLLAVLATWRVTSLFVFEEGPFEVFERIRYAAGVYFLDPDTQRPVGMFGKLLECFWCTSFWVAVPFGLTLTVSWQIIVIVPALSAGAILLEEMIGDSHE